VLVCSIRRMELSFYRRASDREGCGEVDMLAAIPASGWARRGCCRVLLFQAKLGVVLAWSGDVWSGRISSTTAAARTGTSRRLRRRRSRVWAGRVSGGVAVSLRCSTRCKRGQGVLEVVARRVSRARSRATSTAWRRRAGRVCSGQCRASPRPWLALACLVGCGRVVWQGGQGWR
jgi:hypothetical protein